MPHYSDALVRQMKLGRTSCFRGSLIMLEIGKVVVQTLEFIPAQTVVQKVEPGFISEARLLKIVQNCIHVRWDVTA